MKIELRENGTKEVSDSVLELRRQLQNITHQDEEIEVRQELSRIRGLREAIAALTQAVLVIEERTGRMESLVSDLHQLARDTAPAKEWYTVQEAAEALGKAPFTVREWCRLGRVNAAKRDCGRGNSTEWIVAREELIRIQNEGLLPQ